MHPIGLHMVRDNLTQISPTRSTNLYLYFLKAHFKGVFRTFHFFVPDRKTKYHLNHPRKLHLAPILQTSWAPSAGYADVLLFSLKEIFQLSSAIVKSQKYIVQGLLVLLEESALMHRVPLLISTGFQVAFALFTSAVKRMVLQYNNTALNLFWWQTNCRENWSRWGKNLIQ